MTFLTAIDAFNLEQRNCSVNPNLAAQRFSLPQLERHSRGRSANSVPFVVNALNGGRLLLAAAPPAGQIRLSPTASVPLQGKDTRERDRGWCREWAPDGQGRPPRCHSPAC